ncbi:unnamed protein product [Moneuplotes crassus]|uniref:Uncharacterized protein n=2 Tax=Euplotes crassus TaxID=5936 RepID=A0AAD1XXS5_EUPCR|nr:unnamed protein product [Moneuplotes crassus]
MLANRVLRKSYMSKCSAMNSLTKTTLMGYHTIGKSKNSLVKEESVNVYLGQEYEELSNISSEQWFNGITRSTAANKYVSLLPFFMEARFKQKSFVLRMDLLPESEYLKFYTLTLSGIAEKYEAIKNIVPVTRYDYRAIYGRILMKQNTILDLDMVYGNYGTHDLYIFDKSGEWKDEGINHEKLSLENTYNETNWFDEFTPPAY